MWDLKCKIVDLITCFDRTDGSIIKLVLFKLKKKNVLNYEIVIEYILNWKFFLCEQSAKKVS